MKIDVVPIVRELDLGEYHEHYQGKAIQVWVSAPAEFLRRRDVLLVEYGRHLSALQRQVQLRPIPDGGNRVVAGIPLPWKQSPGKNPQALAEAADEARRTAEAAAQRINAWIAETYLPGLHAWFAELFSQGPDAEQHWTADELDTILRSDTQFLEWIKRRASEMIVAYAAEKKRPSAAPSSD